MKKKKPQFLGISLDSNSASQTLLFNTYKEDKTKHPELEKIRGEYPFFLIRKPGTKSYNDCIQIINGLEQSLSKVFGMGLIKRIADNLSPYGITKTQITQCFLKSHSKEERLDIYTNLQNITDYNYMPYKKGPIHLDSVLWSNNPNNNGIKSLLIYTMLKPPKKKYQLTEKDRIDFDTTLDLLYDNWEALNDNKTEEVLKQLQEYYLRQLKPRCLKDKELNVLCGDGLYHLVDKYARWIVLHYEWKDKDDADINPGWFKPSSKPFKRYIKEFRKDLNKLVINL
jgi:hypothetical protein